MKNIFLLPTNAPSRLYEFGGEIILTDTPTSAFRNQTIFIVCSDDIKEDNWYLDKDGLIAKCVDEEFIRSRKEIDGLNKIILATDPMLIAEGVQAINDGFLEWFVKNPTCEEVKIEWNATSICKRVYNIIIPKEETIKNIFLLPTDKPSMLCIDRHKKLLYYAEDNWFKKDEKAKAQNIYITSNEEIKEGYFINGDMLCKYDESHASEEWKTNEFVNGYSLKTNIYYSFESEKCKKVILATDPMLIADGVHKIDDKFLEWFVKNPTCEFVNLFNSKWQLGKDEKDYYDIIIPKKTNKSNEDIWDEVEKRWFDPKMIDENEMNLFNFLKRNYIILKK